MLIGNGQPFNMGYIVMRKSKNRESASTLLSMGHRAYESNRWNPCAYDELKVILSPKLGWHKTKILSRKEAIKAAAKQRRLARPRSFWEFMKLRSRNATNL